MTVDPAGLPRASPDRWRSQRVAVEQRETGGYPATAKRIVVTSTKNMGISIILTVLFGPLGMFYSTIWVDHNDHSFLGGGNTNLRLGLLITWPIVHLGRSGNPIHTTRNS